MAIRLALFAAMALACASPAPPARDGAAGEETPRATTEPEPTDAAATPDPADSDEAPAWLREALTREAEARATETIEAADAAYRFSVPARLVGEPEDDDSRVLLQLDIGSGVPVDCSLASQDADLAGALYRISETALAKDRIWSRKVYRVDASVHASSPMLAADWFYVSRTEDDAPGPPSVFKQWVASVDERTIYCRHDQLGYAHSFDSLFRALVESLEWQDPPPPPPELLEFGVARVGRRRIGVQRFRSIVAEEGHRAELRTWLVVRGHETIQVEDSVQLQVTAPDGRLLREAVVQARNGARTAQHALQASDDGAYKLFSLTPDGRVETDLTPETQPLTLLGQRRLLKELVATAPAERTAVQWSPSLAADSFVDVQLEVGEEIEPGRFSGRMRLRRADASAGFDLDLVVDPAGSLVTTRTQVGERVLRVDRVDGDGGAWSPEGRAPQP